MRFARFLWFVVAALGALSLAPARAAATPNFPGVVAAQLKLDAPPECTLCHVGTPGRGTVTTPFGVSIRGRGAQAYDEASLRTALDALAAEKKDSDGDGIVDTTELTSGTSPNGAGAGVAQPEYGCTVSRRRSPPPSVPFAVCAACMVMCLLAARRAARSPRGVREGAHRVVATAVRRRGRYVVVRARRRFEQERLQLRAEQEVLVDAEDLPAKPSARVDEDRRRRPTHAVGAHRPWDGVAAGVGCVDPDREAHAVLVQERSKRLDLHPVVVLEDGMEADDDEGRAGERLCDALGLRDAS